MYSENEWTEQTVKLTWAKAVASCRGQLPAPVSVGPATSSNPTDSIFLSRCHSPTPPAPNPLPQPPPGWLLFCFQSYGRPGQFVSASTAVSSAGHSDCSAVNIQHPWIGHMTLHVWVLFCARLWIHVCVWGWVEAAGCPLLNQPCRVDSAHRALRAVNNNVSAKGSQTQPAGWRQSLPPPAHIKSTYRTGDRGRWIWQSSSQSWEAWGETCHQTLDQAETSRETVCCSQGTTSPRL